MSGAGLHNSANLTTKQRHQIQAPRHDEQQDTACHDHELRVAAMLGGCWSTKPVVD